MTKNNFEKKEALNFIFNIHDLARQGKFVARYDSLSDEFSLTVPKLTKDARIRYFNEDIALYFNKKNRIEGVFIEYYKNNFMNHEGKDLKDLKIIIQKAEKEKVNEGMVELKGKSHDANIN